MLKKIAALGLVSVLALAPVAAFAEDPAPADPAAAPADAKPMKHKMMKHHSMKHSTKHHSMKKKMKSDAPADAGAPSPASTDAPK